MRNMNLRRIMQLFFFVLIGLIIYNHSAAEAGMAPIPWLSSASVHALCPFGGVETMISLGTMGLWVKKIHASSLVLAGIILVLTLILGPVFCGWVCPLGTFQEWVASIGKKVMGKRYGKMVPKKLDSILKYGRYLVLAWVLYATTTSLKLAFLEVDPYYALYNFWSDEVTVGSLIMLGAVMVTGLFVERPWCRYLCPYGAFLGVFNHIRLAGIRRKSSTCIDCGLCDKACPMGIDVSGSTVVKSTSCISCMKCTSDFACPIQDTATFETGRGSDEA